MIRVLASKETGELHECEICGRIGRDVKWCDNPHKSGYYCQDGEACFARFQEQRNEDISG